MRVMAGACAKTGVVKEAARSVRTRLRSVNMICLFAVGGFRRKAPKFAETPRPLRCYQRKAEVRMGRQRILGTVSRQPRPGSLAVADQHPVASRADLRPIGLQACQYAHRILQVGTAEFVHIGD